jgi:hypothetical protein
MRVVSRCLWMTLPGFAGCAAAAGSTETVPAGGWSINVSVIAPSPVHARFQAQTNMEGVRMHPIGETPWRELTA